MVLLNSDVPGKLLLEITMILDGKPVKKIRAASGQIRISWDEFTGDPEVTIALDKEARITDLTVSATDPNSIRAESTEKAWIRGKVRIPEDIAKEIDKITPYEAYHNGGEGGGLTDNATIHQNLKLLNDEHVAKLRRDIVSEMNMRSAYSVSCLLMVMLGGVLGLIFRGGQFVSALFAATVPATMVIVTILMGKNIAQNSEGLTADNLYSSIHMGITIIWGGIALMAIVTGLIYWRVSKR